jgi:hypothetical protein
MGARVTQPAVRDVWARVRCEEHGGHRDAACAVEDCREDEVARPLVFTCTRILAAQAVVVFGGPCCQTSKRRTTERVA